MSTENQAPKNTPPAKAIELAELFQQERFRNINDIPPEIDVLKRLGTMRLAMHIASAPDRYKRLLKFNEEEIIATPEPKNPITLIRSGVKLPSLSQVFVQLQEALKDPTTNAKDLAEIIRQDPSLSAFLLRMVNSAMFGFKTKIDTITRAVAIVGVKQLSTLAAGTSVMTLFKDVPPEHVNMEQFWMHSLACGFVAKTLAERVGHDDPERCFVAGLLHDIGRLVVYMVAPKEALSVGARMKKEKLNIIEAEEIDLGFNHARFAAILLKMWNLPLPLINAVLHHHGTEYTGEEERTENLSAAEIIYLADYIITSLDVGFSGEYYLQAPDLEIWNKLGLSVQELEKLIQELDMQLQETLTALMPST
ncbi:MAG: HDOD domain-containing protein [Desulfovibrio sp.]